MRIKNDTILKWHLLIDTMNLTNEEFGAMVRNVMMQDDKNELRYKYIEGFVLQVFLQKEEQWKKDLENIMKNNPQTIQAYAATFGQVSYSHEAFDRLQDYYNDQDEQKNNNKGKSKEKDKTPSKANSEGKKGKKLKTIYEFEDDIKMTAEYEEQYKDNIMSDDDFLQTTKVFSYEEIVEAIKAGNLDGWKKHYSEYLMNEGGPF